MLDGDEELERLQRELNRITAERDKAFQVKDEVIRALGLARRDAGAVPLLKIAVASLATALQKYGAHQTGCDFSLTSKDPEMVRRVVNATCNCGLETAINQALQVS